MRLLLLILCGLLLSSCQAPKLNQTTTFTQAKAQTQNSELQASQAHTLETWNYAKLSTFISQGELQANWVTDEGLVTATGGVLVLAEKIMGTLISDTDDAFIIFLNYVGDQGWELIQVRDVDRRTEYLFKQRSSIE